LPPYTTTYLSTISHTDVQLEKTMDYLKDLYPNKKVWVTEWHVGGWGGTLRQYRLRHSYLGGLYANNFFLEMLKYPQVTMSSRHSFKQMVKLAPTSIGGSVADNFHSVEVQNIAKLDMMAMFKGAVLNNKYYASGSLSSMAGYKGTGDYNQSGLPDVNVGLFYNEHNDKGQVFLINKLNKSYQIDKVALSNGTASITDVTLYTHPNTSNGLTQEDTLVTKNISYSAGNAISIPAYSTVKLDIDITGAGDNGGDTETKILLQENFEGGWGIFKSNGSNASIYTGSKAAQGSKAALLRASTGSTASIQAINGFDATPYSEISFNFSFYADTNSGTVRVQCFTGAGWVTLATYHAGSDYQNGSFTTKSITMSANNYAFSKDMKFKFVSVASGGTGDDVYVDDIKLTTEVEVETPDIPDIPDTGTALLTDNFENGWGNFKSNGSNASLYTGSKASQGSKAALLRASTGSTASIVTVNGRDATPYSAVTLNFTLYANTNGGKVRVQCSTDSGWVTLATYQSGSDYINNGFTAKSITIPSSKYTLSNDMKFKFVSVASGGTGDDIYIDDIKVTH
ncbi:hypothetical protein, partial [Paraglaciecola sp.]|uniref:hypothetical protein n=1 Tax=Paraglaciecola sp. TaxID=1920173 RepID=UPI003EF832CE